MDKMIEVKIIGVVPEHDLDREPILEVVNGKTFEVTEIYRDEDPDEFPDSVAPILKDNDYESYQYESEDVITGFAKCGQGLLGYKAVDVYYIPDVSKAMLGGALFILKKGFNEDGELKLNNRIELTKVMLLDKDMILITIPYVGRTAVTQILVLREDYEYNETPILEMLEEMDIETLDDDTIDCTFDIIQYLKWDKGLKE